MPLPTASDGALQVAGLTSDKIGITAAANGITLIVGPIGTPGLGSTSLQDSDHTGLTETVILREESTIDAPPLLVQQRLLQRLRLDGLHAESRDSFDEEHALLVRAGVAGVTKTVAMATFPPYLRGQVTVIPIRWVATGPLGELFPTLEANLEVGPTGDGRTLFVLIGAYRPPLRRIGQRIDRLVMHNVGTATARGFLSRLTAQVMTCPEADLAAEPGRTRRFTDAVSRGATDADMLRADSEPSAT